MPLFFAVILSVYTTHDNIRAYFLQRKSVMYAVFLHRKSVMYPIFFTSQKYTVYSIFYIL